MKPKITSVKAREVLDSRGRPTVEVDVVVDDRILGRAMVPSGASTGSAEALELRDGDPERYSGMGVLRAIHNVNTELAPLLIGRDPRAQDEIDQAMMAADGTPNKSRLGANALLGASLACARAAASLIGKPLYRYIGEELSRRTGSGADGGDNGRGVEGIAADGRADARYTMPLPMVNMISGGKHSENNLDLQDFLIIPGGARRYSEALLWTSSIYESLRRVLQRTGRFTPGVADEGGFGPILSSHEEALELLVAAIEEAGFVPGEQVWIAIDVAATEVFREGRYHLSAEKKVLDSAGMVELLEDWCRRYPILSIEDGLAEDDFDGWRQLTSALGERAQLIGDDLFTTNPDRLRMGIDQRLANAVLVKVNQIGTLTESLNVVEAALAAEYLPVISARSGETEDPFIADLAVGTGAGQIKIGSITRSERTAKYNQLLRIEEELGDAAYFPGRSIFDRFIDRAKVH